MEVKKEYIVDIIKCVEMSIHDLGNFIFELKHSYPNKEYVEKLIDELKKYQEILKHLKGDD